MNTDAFPTLREWGHHALQEILMDNPRIVACEPIPGGPHEYAARIAFWTKGNVHCQATITVDSMEWSRVRAGDAT